MAHGNANLGAKSIENDLAGNEKEDAKGNVTQRPPVLQRSDNKQDLHANVDKELNGVEQVQDDKQTDSVGRTNTRPSFKGSQRDEERNGKGNDRAEPQHPHGQRRSILVQLKAHKPIDQQTRHNSTGQTILHARKVRKRPAARRHNTSINNKRDESKQHIEVEESQNLLAADGGELGAHVQDHDDGHDEGADVGEGGGALKDDCVGHLDVARVAAGLDADAARRRQDGADGGAEGQRRVLADGREVAKARHDGGVLLFFSDSIRVLVRVSYRREVGVVSFDVVVTRYSQARENKQKQTSVVKSSATTSYHPSFLSPKLALENAQLPLDATQKFPNENKEYATFPRSLPHENKRASGKTIDRGRRKGKKKKETQSLDLCESPQKSCFVRFSMVF